MARPQLADISSFQSSGINWQAYKQWSSNVDGTSRIIMRVNEGTGTKYVDPNFAENERNALAVGIDQIVYYHYAYPQFNSAAASASFFALCLGPIRKGDVLMLDYEEMNPSSTAQWALDWLDAVQAAYPNNKVIIYSYYSMIEAHLQDSRLTRFPLYYANWQYTITETPTCPPPWESYCLLQWSDQAVIPGIAGVVDGDLYIGGLPMPTPVVTPPADNPHFDQAVLDNWSSFFKMLQSIPAVLGVNPQPPLPAVPIAANSAIFASYKAFYAAGHQFGAATSYEYDSIDWNGNPLVCQNFSGARAEHVEATQKTRWFTPSGEITL